MGKKILRISKANTWDALPEEIKNAMRRMRQLLLYLPIMKKISDLVKSGKNIKIEIGCGRRLPGYISIDLYVPSADLRVDVKKGLPFPENSVDEIYSSHLLEHLFIDEIRLFLKECQRILKKDGLIRLSVPNAKMFVDAYYNSKDLGKDMLRYDKACLNYNSKIDYVNYIAYCGRAHHHMFDGENLLEVLKEAGFEKAKLREFIPGLDVESRIDESIYGQARKI